MKYFEGKFNVQVHFLRTYIGVIYLDMIVFYQRTGIGRKLRELETSASNKKAKKRHFIFMNMVRCMHLGHNCLECIVGKRLIMLDIRTIFHLFWLEVTTCSCERGDADDRDIGVSIRGEGVRGTTVWTILQTIAHATGR